MKKLYCIMFLTFSFVMSFAQSLNDLDKDPSFKGITIGAPISKYSDILSFSHISKGKNVYRVNQSKYLSIFNVRMHEMIVVESEGKVYAIQLSKTIPTDDQGCNIFNADDLLSWCSNLMSKYGKFISLDNMSGTPSVCGMRWKANTVVLDIVYLFYGTYDSERPKLQYCLYQNSNNHLQQ